METKLWPKAFHLIRRKGTQLRERRSIGQSRLEEQAGVSPVSAYTRRTANRFYATIITIEGEHYFVKSGPR